MKRAPDHTIAISLVLGILAFGLDRMQKFIQISPACMGFGTGPCVNGASAVVPLGATGWRGGEYVPVTSFFDYVLVWNKGISYGLLTALPVAVLGVVMVVAIIALCVWWVRAPVPLVRAGLALCIGGALSNATDRWMYGAVADFFHFHFQQYSFYIFNIADTAITLGVFLLVLDFLGVGRPRNHDDNDDMKSV